MGEFVPSTTAGEGRLTDAEIRNREWLASGTVGYVINTRQSVTLNHTFSSMGRRMDDRAHPEDEGNNIPQRLTKNVTGLGWQIKYDRHSLAPLRGSDPYAGRYTEVSPADKFRWMNLDIHDGRLFGLTGKIVMFLASLVGASLPVTGFVLWRRKRRGGLGIRPSFPKKIPHRTKPMEDSFAVNQI